MLQPMEFKAAVELAAELLELEDSPLSYTAACETAVLLCREMGLEYQDSFCVVRGARALLDQQ